MQLNAYAKAIIAALSSGVIMFFALRGDGLSGDDWATIITSALAAGGFTWAVPNAPLKNTSKTTLEVESSGPMPTTGDTWIGTAGVPASSTTSSSRHLGDIPHNLGRDEGGL